MKLHLNTVSDLLWKSLKTLMSLKEFDTFRIVGGTSLSLQLGHRESSDIDLFTDAEYGSVNFEKIEKVLIQTFPFVELPIVEMVGIGKSYFIGNNKNDLVKLDLFYTDTYVFPIIIEQNVRFSSIEEVIAMKFEVIGQGGRKKDFWDIHELLSYYTFNEMFEFYEKRNSFGYSKIELLDKIIDFSIAENEFTPNCFKDKNWEIIKLDFEDLVKNQ